MSKRGEARIKQWHATVTQIDARIQKIQAMENKARDMLSVGQLTRQRKLLAQPTSGRLE